jgi:beta-galactosidase
MATFEIGEHDFLLDGQPHQVIAGALHYFRVHPDQWADRIHKARLMGLNAIETYVAWNLHAPREGEFDLTGPRDLARFLDLVAAEGLHAIVRPGPYICAEWDDGGLPAWLLAKPGVGVRRHEPQFLAAVDDYLGRVLPLVAERQVTRGGPVVLVQVENEYGAYGDDPQYLRALARMTRAHGIDVPLVTCDQADDAMLARGGVPELLRTATFGSRTTERLATLRRHQPTGPLMCMEFWDGWFDSRGLHHHTTAPEQSADDLDDLLAAGGSVNVYMFHGGTNFGLTNGANDKGRYLPITTSYDYDAPLSEHGATTEKYRALRKVIARHAPVPGETPTEPAPGPELTVPLEATVPLLDTLDLLGARRSFDRLPTHDELGQWSGLSVYTTRVAADDALIGFAAVHDHAVALLDGAPVGRAARTDGQTALSLPAAAGELALVVEDQGRVNYGPRIGEPKGLLGPARTATREVADWDVVPLELDELPAALVDRIAAGASVASAGIAGPAWCTASFASEPGRDHHLRLDGFGRALVWLDGRLLGRYDAAGPTRTMYVPGPLVREQNRLVVLELHAASTGEVRLVASPDLGPCQE